MGKIFQKIDLGWREGSEHGGQYYMRQRVGYVDCFTVPVCLGWGPINGDPKG
jgi:hypothetical protein